MSGVDDVEYANLAEQVRRVELLVDADTRGNSSYLLKNFLHNAKSRMDEIRHEEFRADDEKKDQKAKDTASIAQLAEMEHRLNAQEKHQYSRFLQLDYFRRKDLDELAAFYKDDGGYDKLSEEGKEEMTKRVAEGIRRGEFDFEQMPEPMRNKAAERLPKYGVEVPVQYSSATDELPKTSLHVGKSDSNESDYLKETKLAEYEKISGEKKVKEEATTQNLAFDDSPAPVKPTEVQSTGTGRSI